MLTLDLVMLGPEADRSLLTCLCRELTPLPRFAAGALAGATAVAVTYPLDLVRAQLAIQTRLKLK